MTRARHNVEAIVVRLGLLDYRFIGIAEECDRDRRYARGMDEVMEHLGPRPDEFHQATMWLTLKSTGLVRQVQAQLTQPEGEHQPYERYSEGASRYLKRLERLGVVLPLSLEAWLEEVGSVDLTGAHPSLCFVEGDEGFPNIFADPLAVDVPLGYLAEEYANEPIDCPLSQDDEGKAGLHECEYYTVRIPNSGADAMLLGERHNTTFVNYLRHAFRWGGFPGWDQYDNPPQTELAILTDGLLPI
jgi:hypothetical protein